MTVEILVATRNPGKRDELARLLAGLPVRWIALGDLGIMSDVPETGSSFGENAAQKALSYCKLTSCWTVADDSGLCVDALDGRPGIHSARYAGGHAVPFPDKWAALLDELSGVPWNRRDARFECALALALPDDGQALTAEGTCRGRIAFAPAGTGGFGYDPLFYLPEYGCTMAQLEDREKDDVGHRGRAAQALMPLLQRLLAERSQKTARR